MEVIMFRNNSGNNSGSGNNSSGNNWEIILP